MITNSLGPYIQAKSLSETTHAAHQARASTFPRSPLKGRLWREKWGANIHEEDGKRKDRKRLTPSQWECEVSYYQRDHLGLWASCSAPVLSCYRTSVSPLRRHQISLNKKKKTFSLQSQPRSQRSGSEKKKTWNVKLKDKLKESWVHTPSLTFQIGTWRSFWLRWHLVWGHFSSRPARQTRLWSEDHTTGFQVQKAINLCFLFDY